MTEAGKPVTWSVEPSSGMVRITAPLPGGHSAICTISPEDTRRLAVGLWQGAALADNQMPLYEPEPSTETIARGSSPSATPNDSSGDGPPRKTIPQRIRAAIGVVIYTIVLGWLLCAVRL